MILFPAIDLKDGQCVRLVKGDMDKATVFSTDPAAQARAFEDQGFEYLHLVDLNGAFAGAPVNDAAVRSILAAITIPAQLGGGIRDRATIDMWLERGIERVILGTIAVREPELVRAACRAHPGRIVVGLDARDGRVAVDGWAQTSDLSVAEMAARFEDAGAAAIVFTDIERDGVLRGLNMPATLALAHATRVPVIASGGLSSMRDIEALVAPQGAVLEGAICGRALYDGRLDARAALGLIAAAASEARC